MPSQLGKSKAPILVGPGERGLPSPEASKVRFYEVGESDIKAAEEALERDEIPLEFKKEVKEYFEQAKGK